MNAMREMVKAVVRGVAFVLVLPRIVSFRIAKTIIGSDRALEGATQSLARIPGVRGQYLRRAFLSQAIERCHDTAAICWGTTFSKAGSLIDDNVYVGPSCHLGLVHLERDVLLAAGVHVPSGAQTHGTDDLLVPIREQPGRVTMVRIGAGTWVGSGAIVMADVGQDCVIAAGSVVTKPIPDHVVAAGVPARVIRSREAMAVQRA
jgi:acetyltransferase-like isoleucine patch superfamily enzyme